MAFPTSPDAARELYAAWLARAWNGEADALADLVTDDFVGHWPRRDVHGREALAATIWETRRLFDDLVFTVSLGPVVEGDLLAARWTGVGTTAGRETRFVGHDLLRLREGRFCEYWVATVGL